MGEIVSTTFNVDKDIKREFKIECAKNEVEMSITIQTMMKDYVEASRELRKALEENKSNNETAIL